MLKYIRDAKSPKDAWGDLKRVFDTNIITCKLQLKQELNNIQQGGMSVTDYTMMIKDICDGLGSINMIVDEDEMV